MNKINKLRLTVLLVFAAAAFSPLSALTVKLASPFPEGSEWDNILKQMAADWSDITGGKVRMRIYPGGVAGDEADMIRKMRFGQIDAAVLTTFGLKAIYSDIFILSLPGLIHNDEELNYILKKFTPQFNAEYEKEGFQILAWSKGGWAYFFSKNPDSTPDMLRREKLAVSSTDQEFAGVLKSLKFNVVPTAMNELLVSLQSGMVSAFYNPPMASAAYQLFTLAPYMIDFPVAAVIGGIVISDRTWKRIPAQYHDELKAVIEKAADSFFYESERLNLKAMDIMTQNGLEVVQVNDTQKEQWYSLFESGTDMVVGDGKWISTALYNDFVKTLGEVR